MDNKTINDFLERVENEIQGAINKLKKYIIIHPTNKPLIDKLDLDKRFYEVICIKFVERDKFYITDKDGYESLFGKNYRYYPYITHISKDNNKELDDYMKEYIPKGLKPSLMINDEFNKGLITKPSISNINDNVEEDGK